MLHLRARRLIEHLLETDASDGIYYLARMPSRWEVFPLPYAEFEEVNHDVLWAEMVVPPLASAWAKRLRSNRVELERQLLPLLEGFPRGRIERAPGKLAFEVFHGSSPVRMKAEVERCFGLAGQCRWSLADHYEVVAEEAAQLRQILDFREVW